MLWVDDCLSCVVGLTQRLNIDVFGVHYISNRPRVLLNWTLPIWPHYMVHMYTHSPIAFGRMAKLIPAQSHTRWGKRINPVNVSCRLHQTQSSPCAFGCRSVALCVSILTALSAGATLALYSATGSDCPNLSSQLNVSRGTSWRHTTTKTNTKTKRHYILSRLVGERCAMRDGWAVCCQSKACKSVRPLCDWRRTVDTSIASEIACSSAIDHRKTV